MCLFRFSFSFKDRSLERVCSVSRSVSKIGLLNVFVPFLVQFQS